MSGEVEDIWTDFLYIWAWKTNNCTFLSKKLPFSYAQNSFWKPGHVFIASVVIFMSLHYHEKKSFVCPLTS